MDDYIPVHLCDAVLPEDIPHDEMIERVFRRRSTETEIPINELAFNPEYTKNEYNNYI